MLSADRLRRCIWLCSNTAVIVKWSFYLERKDVYFQMLVVCREQAGDAGLCVIKLFCGKQALHVPPKQNKNKKTFQAKNADLI